MKTSAPTIRLDPELEQEAAVIPQGPDIDHRIRDPDDVEVLAQAMGGLAEVLVTGDGHDDRCVHGDVQRQLRRNPRMRTIARMRDSREFLNLLRIAFIPILLTLNTRPLYSHLGADRIQYPKP